MNLIECNFSKITLKVKGIGIKIIFGNDASKKFPTDYFPNEVYINRDIQETVNYSYSYKLDKYRRLLLSKKMFNLDDNCVLYSKGCLEDLYLYLNKDKRDSYSLEKEISI